MIKFFYKQETGKFPRADGINVRKATTNNIFSGSPLKKLNWSMPVIPAHGRWRQENLEFEAVLSYI
jgi:hypothetical protein